MSVDCCMSAPSSPVADVAIIGGGFSGTAVAAQLLRRANTPLRLVLIERYSHQLHRGVAYATPLADHLLNVRACDMSAYPDDPDHFLRWVAARDDFQDELPLAVRFLPRGLYGDYLSELVDHAEALSPVGNCLERCLAEATAVTATTAGAIVQLADGRRLAARHVVLALGNSSPRLPPALAALADSERMIADPWAGTGLDIPTDARCLVLGSGLTSVDCLLTLLRQGHRGQLYALSRRGLWPQPHGGPVTAAELPDPLPPRLTALTAWLRHQAAAVSDWRPLVEALRRRSEQIWQTLPEADRRRFLRHLKPYWDAHRHRISPYAQQRLQRLLDDGRLHALRGRIVAGSRHGATLRVEYRPYGSRGTQILEVDHVINCTGPDSGVGPTAHPLVKDLLARGLAARDPLGLGLLVDEDGRLLDAANLPSPVLSLLGPPCRGPRWESTAVPDIRNQALAIAERLLREIHSPRERVVAARPDLRAAPLGAPA